MTSSSQANTLNESYFSAQSAWEKCITIIRGQVTTLSFKTWFQPIKPISFLDNKLTIQVPSQFFYDWLEEHYSALIHKTIINVLGESGQLLYLVNKDDPSSSLLQQEISELQSEQTSVNRPTFTPHTLYRTENVQSLRSNLNPKYTFDNFIRGDCNQLARAAALAVANNPGGTSFNPLVLYGGTGLGKTHLMHALGNHAIISNKAMRVVYISSEKFTIDFVDAIQTDKVNNFSMYYRSIDLLIVDDIQFFAGKEKTQDNFFHTFNALYQIGKQIVLSSDVPPKELRGLDERLISRFQCGLTADLQSPDLETRIAILQKKSEENAFEMPQEVIEFIAANIVNNIRELEGCLVSMLARASLENREIDITLAKDVLKVFVNTVCTPLNIEKIQESVSEYFNIPSELIRAKTRRQEVVIARQFAMYFAKELTNSSLKTIGLHFGGRDHSTVIHACQAIEEYIRSNTTYKQHLDRIKQILIKNL
jgi:chromosomal replication initiator protein